MHQSWLCTAAPLSTLPSQSVLSFDHNVSVLQLHPFSSFLHKAVIVHIISCQMLLELKKRFVWLIFYQCTFGTYVRYKSLCRMQTLDPISTPLAWPIVSVMSAIPSHPQPQGDSHQGCYGMDWEKTCDWSFLLSPYHSNTAGRTTVSAGKWLYVWTCVPMCWPEEVSVHLPVSINVKGRICILMHFSVCMCDVI